MTTRMRPLLLAAGVALAGGLGAQSPAVSSIVDGGFDGGVVGWKTLRTLPAGCDTPYRSVFIGDSNSTAAFLGDTRLETTPGCDPSLVFQDFDCSNANPTVNFCTVSFEASLWLVAGECAAVVVSAGDAVVAREIPGARSGRSGRYVVSVSGSGKARVAFAVWSTPGTQAGTRSLLMVDNVKSFVTDRDLSSPVLVQIHTDALPFVPRTLDGHNLQRYPGVTDCNANKIPDTYEISQGIAADSDGDRLPDDCGEEKRQVDWVLLGLGVLILVATLFRHVVGRKSRSA